MTTKSSVSEVYAMGFPINLTIELLINFLSVFISVNILVYFYDTGNIALITLGVILAYYTYCLSILFLGALAIRLLPKPGLGYISTKSDNLKFQIHSALNKMIRRTPARWLIIFPFPAYWFYKLAGARIASSAFQSSPDSIPDVYLVRIGKNTLLGWNSSIFGHCSPDSATTLLGKVAIGDDVLIGAESIIWPNVIIGDGAIVQNKAVVVPGTIIPKGEVWGGMPARKIGEVRRNVSKKIDKEQIAEKISEVMANQLGDTMDNLNAASQENTNSPQHWLRCIKYLEKEYGLFFDRTKINLDERSVQALMKALS